MITSLIWNRALLLEISTRHSLPRTNTMFWWSSLSEPVTREAGQCSPLLLSLQLLGAVTIGSLLPCLEGDLWTQRWMAEERNAINLKKKFNWARLACGIPEATKKNYQMGSSQKLSRASGGIFLSAPLLVRVGSCLLGIVLGIERNTLRISSTLLTILE